MTIRSTLFDTVLVGTKDGAGIKRKLTIALVAIVGVTILLRFRGDDTQTDEAGEEPTGKEEHKAVKTETVTEESTTGDTGSATKSLTDGQRELDMFDMLAIVAAAITEARDEYHKRTGR
ncbi:hypothetical protein [Halocatena pleomorpha]|uniref:Uncharacterized protein n=1 Tax=Halocatena pleomorpha TaxID=1785090 RepID=A0A3P3RDL0_9EURY|nr:hypothetical protein [Halocatena pleomorpha]RRJ30543.1 hypothetical protein EIK79_09695 [Halocatena pleomorpha]